MSWKLFSAVLTVAVFASSMSTAAAFPGTSHEHSKKMLGWAINEYSGVSTLKLSSNIDIPKIKSKHDVLVEIHTASVNRLDVVMTEGYGRKVLNALRCVKRIKEFPLIVGRDFVGVVRARGRSVRDDIQVGDKVWGIVPSEQQGSFAEFVVVNHNTITRKPEKIDDVGAAGILFAGLTAWSSIYVSGLAGGLRGALTSRGGGSGKHICILGASGGVGTLAVQMAKAENMKITATSGTRSVQMVKELGADIVIDYQKDDLNDKFRGQSYDIIFDAAGLGPDYATTLPWKFSQYITLEPPFLNNTDSSGLVLGTIKSVWSLLKSNAHTIFSKRGLLKWGVFMSASQGIEYLKNLVESGKMKPIIDSTFEFNETKKAFEKVANGHLRGKVIVKVK